MEFSDEAPLSRPNPSPVYFKYALVLSFVFEGAENHPPSQVLRLLFPPGDGGGLI